MTEDKIKVGQEFMESTEVLRWRKRRTVLIIQIGVYHALVKVIDGPGRNREIQVWNKHLCDPQRWKFIDPGNAHTVQM